MALLGNIIWFILFGWWNFLIYGLLGLLSCATIIGIPIGKALFQYAKLMTLPFGKVIIKETDLKGKENVALIRRIGGTIANIIWLPIGIIMFILNIGAMIACAVTIIGIPAAVVIAKSCKFLIWPVGAKVITKDQAETLRMEKSMMKVMGTAVAVNNMMTNQAVTPQAIPTAQAVTPQAIPTAQAVTPQAIPTAQAAMPQAIPTAQTVQPQQALPMAAGTQIQNSIKEAGAKAMSAIAGTGSAGVSALKDRQSAMQEQVLSGEKDVTVNELLAQVEAKLYRNKVMAWMMPFLEYITPAVAVICIIIGMIAARVSYRTMLTLYIDSYSVPELPIRLIGELFYGIVLAAPFMIIAVLLGMIKRNHIFVLIVLGAELLSHIILGIMRMGLSGQWILFYAGSIAGYVYLFLIKKSAEQPRAAFDTGISGTAGMDSGMPDISAGNVPAFKKYCGQCGADVSGGITFCGKCGAKVE